MADLLLIIQTIMKYQKTNALVDVTTTHAKYSGYITKYTGQIHRNACG